MAYEYIDILGVDLFFVLHNIMLVYALNPVPGGNYFYLVDRPIFKQLAEPLYMTGLFIVCYLIFYLGDKVFTYASQRLVNEKILLTFSNYLPIS